MPMAAAMHVVVSWLHMEVVPTVMSDLRSVVIKLCNGSGADRDENLDKTVKLFRKQAK